MLHELVFLGCHTQIASYRYMFALYSYGCKILQPYVAATVRMRSDAVLSSTGALLMKTVIKNNCQWQMVHIRFGRIRWLDTCESALTIGANVLIKSLIKDLGQVETFSYYACADVYCMKIFFPEDIQKFVFRTSWLTGNLIIFNFWKSPSSEFYQTVVPSGVTRYICSNADGISQDGRM